MFVKRYRLQTSKNHVTYLLSPNVWVNTTLKKYKHNHDFICCVYFVNVYCGLSVLSEIAVHLYLLTKTDEERSLALYDTVGCSNDPDFTQKCPSTEH